MATAQAPRWAPVAVSVTESQLRGPEMAATWKEGGQGSVVFPPRATTCQAAEGKVTTVTHSLFREVFTTDQLRADSAMSLCALLLEHTSPSLKPALPQL